jgi:hypothetical protein
MEMEMEAAAKMAETVNNEEDRKTLEMVETMRKVAGTWNRR